MVRLGAMVVAVSLVMGACASETNSTTTDGISDADEKSSTTMETSSNSDSQASSTTATVDSSVPSTTLGSSKGTFENPVQGGEFAQVGDWKVRVIDVTPDATEIVMDDNSFNDPPAEGNQFFMTTLEAEYVGNESGNFWIDLTWKAVGPSAVAYEEGEATCGVFEDSITDAGETFPGGTITGNVCWSVDTNDASDLVMLLDDTFSLDNDTRTTYQLTGVDSE